MALTAYDAIKPSLKAPPNSVITIAGTATTILGSAFGSWAPGEYCVIILTTSGSADPTSVTSNGIAFTKRFGANGISIYSALNNTVNTFTLVTITATYAVAVRAITGSFIVKDATAMAVGAGASSTGVAQATSVGCGSVTPSASSNALVVSCLGIFTPTGIAPVFASVSATPPSIVALGASDFVSNAGLTYAWIIAASQGEDIDTTQTFAALFNNVSAAGTTENASGVMFYFTGRQVSLDDVTYQLGNDGPLLNNPSGALPLYDIETVSGLSDLDVTNSSNPIDGTDGSYIEGSFLTGKTVVIDGTMYSAAPFNESLIDGLKAAAAPVVGGKPFYFKHAGLSPRKQDGCVPIALKVPIDRNRALAQVPFELQFLTADSFFVSLDFTATSFLGQSSVTVGGSDEAYPVIYFNILAADVANGTLFRFFNNTWIAKYSNASFFSGSIVSLASPTAFAVTVDPTLAGVGVYKLDLKRRILWRLTPQGQVDVSNSLVYRVWWTLIPGTVNDVNLTRSTGTDKMQLSFRNTWL